ncbi:tetratricopeptide repeat protein [Anabaena azotica]|uniref:tetratricopeptide repeat protein n=1 Tax=Anabaena azotica TaxID=197653 RepID=UPI0039A4268B
MLRRFSVIVATFIFWHLCSFVTLAEGKKPEEMDKFPPGPLEMTTPDPLVRGSVDKQPLTLEELQKLETSLDELNQEATTTLQAGDKLSAFEIWNRELRLRRFLGSLAEVQALSRVGAIAWNENERQQVKYITQRLQVIEKQMLKQTSTDLELWRSLGEAYQNIRVPKLAVGAYQQILTLFRQQNNTTSELETLNKIGELHLSWFDYSQAATTYQELLNFAISQGDRPNEIKYLQQLVYIFEKAKQHQQAINVLSKLAAIYTSDDNLTQIPALKIAIAENYQSLAQENPNFLQEAFNKYQEAYVTAWQSQQYVTASEALQKLIKLYSSQNQIDEALQTSQILLETETLATNFYGLMQAYDQIGQLYLEKKEDAKALTAFQQGLKIAQQLKYQETYFAQKIETLSKGNF